MIERNFIKIAINLLLYENPSISI
ncbi:hypothetical protein YPPY14_0911, partial [Yersinia pestis PY-14]